MNEYRVKLSNAGRALDTGIVPVLASSKIAAINKVKRECPDKWTHEEAEVFWKSWIKN